MAQYRPISCSINNSDVDLGIIANLNNWPAQVPHSFDIRCASNVYISGMAQAGYCLEFFSITGAFSLRNETGREIITRLYSRTGFGRSDLSLGRAAGGFTTALVGNAQKAGRSGTTVGDIAVPSDFIAAVAENNFYEPGHYTASVGLQLWSGGRRNVRTAYPGGMDSGECQSLGGYTTGQLNMKLTIKSACNIRKIQDINFGKQSFLEKSFTAEGRFAVTCSSGTEYAMQINEGLHSADGRQRAMENPASEDLVFYDLYRNASYTQLWRAADRVRGKTGTGREQIYSVYAKTLPNQSNKAPGAYADTLVITVNSIDGG